MGFFMFLILSYEKATKRTKALDNTPIKAYNVIKGKNKPTQTKQTTET